MRRTVLVFFALLLSVRADAALSKSDLHAWLEEAIAAAAEVPAEQRRDFAYSLDIAGDTAEQAKTCLLKLALRPSSPAWWDLLAHMPLPERMLVAEFLEAEYRARAGVENDERTAWQQGLAEMLFTMGRFADGLELQRAVVARGGASAYAIDLLAIMENMAGSRDAYARVAAAPPAPLPSISEESAEVYFQSILRSVARRMKGLVPPDKVPPQLAVMLTSARDWPSRINNVLALSTTNMAKGYEELETILADSSAPSWAHDDAIYALAQILHSTTQSAAREVDLLECWIARRGITIPAASADTWIRLRELKPRPQPEIVDSFTRECYWTHGHDTATTDCQRSTAGHLMNVAHNSHNYEELRRGIEWMAALAVAEGKGLEDVTMYLYFASHQAKTREEHDRILQYVGTLPTRDMLDPLDDENEILGTVRKQTTRSVDAPWTAPVAAAAPKCPR